MLSVAAAYSHVQSPIFVSSRCKVVPSSAEAIICPSLNPSEQFSIVLSAVKTCNVVCMYVCMYVCMCCIYVSMQCMYVCMHECMYEGRIKTSSCVCHQTVLVWHQTELIFVIKRCFFCHQTVLFFVIKRRIFCHQTEHQMDHFWSLNGAIVFHQTEHFWDQTEHVHTNIDTYMKP